MALINPYLTFNGNCEEAFDFYKSVFGGEFSFVGRFGDMPPDEEHTIPDEQKNLIMHISLPIKGTSVLMGSDTGGEWGAHHVVGTNISISITASSRDEADRIFNALGEGGRITMPMNDAFWGDYFGMLTDRFGINWMMGYNENTPG